HRRRHAHAVPVRPLPGPRSGPAPGPGQRGERHPVRAVPASRHGRAGADGAADSGDLVAVSQGGPGTPGGERRRAAVFLDKDGTLVDDVPYNVDPERIRLTDGALDGLRRLHAADYLLIVVSNQSGVARGYFEEAALGAVEARLRELLGAAGVPLAGFYYCPHHPDGAVERYAVACACRKPASG